MKVELTKPAEKDLKKLDRPTLKRVIEALEQLSVRPETTDLKKLKGFDNKWRLKVGTYRIILLMNQEEAVIYVLHIRHRKEAYR